MEDKALVVFCVVMSPGKTQVDIVYQPRSEWPKSVRDVLDKHYRDCASHNVQLCRDATIRGEGCPIDNCRCTCHDTEGDD